MPALIALITTVVSFSVSMQSIARERELGTIDELLILPLSRFEILIGKLAPGFVVALFNVLVFIVLIPLIYGVPLKGSIVLLLGATFCFGLSIAGIGLSVSTVTQNQQQAFLAGFLFIVPMIMVSGYVTPYDNMPGWLQIAAKFDPLYHMLIICQGTFLKEIPLYSVFQHTWPMLGIACFTLGVATFLFRFRIE
jgi:ABC-2 type transport system permease protein